MSKFLAVPSATAPVSDRRPPPVKGPKAPAVETVTHVAPVEHVARPSVHLAPLPVGWVFPRWPAESQPIDHAHVFATGHEAAVMASVPLGAPEPYGVRLSSVSACFPSEARTPLSPASVEALEQLAGRVRGAADRTAAVGRWAVQPRATFFTRHGNEICLAQPAPLGHMDLFEALRATLPIAQRLRPEARSVTFQGIFAQLLLAGRAANRSMVIVDMKPENTLLFGKGRLALLDLGDAVLLPEGVNTVWVRSNAIVHTVTSAPPEMGKVVDGRVPVHRDATDMFSLGAELGMVWGALHGYGGAREFMGRYGTASNPRRRRTAARGAAPADYSHACWTSRQGRVLKGMLESMTAMAPAKRPTFDGLVKRFQAPDASRPWFAGDLFLAFAGQDDAGAEPTIPEDWQLPAFARATDQAHALSREMRRAPERTPPSLAKLRPAGPDPFAELDPYGRPHRPALPHASRAKGRVCSEPERAAIMAAFSFLAEAEYQRPEEEARWGVVREAVIPPSQDHAGARELPEGRRIRSEEPKPRPGPRAWERTQSAPAV